MMLTKKPINCPSCGELVFDDEERLRYLLLKEDVLCPKCKSVVLAVPRVEYWTGTQKTEINLEVSGEYAARKISG